MSAAPYYEDDAVTIYHGDCREVMADAISFGSIDLALTDPPYGIAGGAAFVRSGGEIVARRDYATENQEVSDWFGTLAWTVRTSGYVAAFHRRGAAPEHKGWGLKPHHKFYLVKQAPPVCPRHTFQSGVEECSIFVKLGEGTRFWGGGGATPNYWLGLTPGRLKKGHGHEFEKPLAAMLTLVRCLCPPGGLVLDPFMGSGTTLRAAKDLGRRAIGIEIEEKYCEIAARRMEQEVLPL